MKIRRLLSAVILGSAVVVLCGITLARVIKSKGGQTLFSQKGSDPSGFYYCPMHPSYTSNRPGNCPICGMQLVKRQERQATMDSHRHEEKLPGYAPVVIAPQRLQLIGIKAAPVKKQELIRTIRTVGKIAYDSELYQAEAEYLQAIRALKDAQGGSIPEVKEQANRLVEAARLRLRLLGMGEAQIEEMSHWTHPDQSLLLSDSTGRVWVYANLYEYELPYVQVGQKMKVEVPALGDKVLEGEVRAIDPVLNPATRSARVRAQITDPEKQLRPQMYVNVLLEIPLGQALSVPVEAVFDTGVRKIIFVQKGDGLFEPREITIGRKADGAYELKSGAAEGEFVVTSGNFLIDSESRLKSALEGASSAGPAPEDHSHVH